MSKKGERHSGLTAPDSIVRRMVGEAQARQDIEQGKDGRGRPGHGGGQVGVDNLGRTKATYSISLAAQEIARAIGEAEEISQADVVDVALRALDQLYKGGKIDLLPFKIPARSLKATWKLEGLEKIKIF
jgi:hypothetical protein